MLRTFPRYLSKKRKTQRQDETLERLVQVSYAPDLTYPREQTLLETERIKRLPALTTPSKVEFVQDPGQAQDLIQKHFTSESLLGFDCEWKPGNRTPVAILSISSHFQVAVFRILRWKKLPDALVDLLADPFVVKFGHDPLGEMQRLNQKYRVQFASVIDTLHLARFFQCRPATLSSSLTAISRIKFQKDKKIQMMNWEKEHLGRAELAYAAKDAAATYVLGAMSLNRMMEAEELKDMSSLEYARSRGLLMGEPVRDFPVTVSSELQNLILISKDNSLDHLPQPDVEDEVSELSTESLTDESVESTQPLATENSSQVQDDSSDSDSEDSDSNDESLPYSKKFDFSVRGRLQDPTEDWTLKGYPTTLDEFLSKYGRHPSEILFMASVDDIARTRPREPQETLKQYAQRLNLALELPRFFSVQRVEGHCKRCWIALIKKVVQNFAPTTSKLSREHAALKALYALIKEAPLEFGDVLTRDYSPYTTRSLVSEFESFGVSQANLNSRTSCYDSLECRSEFTLTIECGGVKIVCSVYGIERDPYRDPLSEALAGCTLLRLARFALMPLKNASSEELAVLLSKDSRA